MFKVYIQYGSSMPVVYTNSETYEKAMHERAMFLLNNPEFECYVVVPDLHNVELERSENF